MRIKESPPASRITTEAAQGPTLPVQHTTLACQRCGVEAELGRCPFCHRDLCVTCYDGDQNGYCHPPPLVERDDAIRALHGSMEVSEIAERFNLSPRRVYGIVG